MKIDTVNKISRAHFYNDYVHKEKPVLITGMMEGWQALAWSRDIFKQSGKDIRVPIKTGDISKGHKELIQLSDYVKLLEDYENRLNSGDQAQPPGYLHDYPFFYAHSQFLPDIEPFPLSLFPEWYRKDFQNYIQFFMGAKGSLTPLHFDTLCTHNLFFQVVGSKKFLLIPYKERKNCYMNGWRWADFNPDNPDYDLHTRAKGLPTYEVEIKGGEMLYIPSGMLHQVHGLSFSISFNIDWHNNKSVWRGMTSVLKGAPRKNFYYNYLLFLGLVCKMPSGKIFDRYKSYLNYTS